MFIKNMKVTNFKSFEEAHIDFGRFNVVVGANASGKSNFISVFRFLKDIVESGLDNAISMQGGVDYLRNIKVGASESMSVELCIDCRDESVFVFPAVIDKEPIGVSPREFLYRLTIGFHEGGKGYRIAEERMTISLGFSRMQKGEKKGILKILGGGKVTFLNDGEKIIHELDENIPRNIAHAIVFHPFLEQYSRENLFKGKLFLEVKFPLLSLPADSQLKDFIRCISLYDFDPKLSKTATRITGKSELEPDGSNLAIVLKNILEDENEAEKFSDIVQSVLPFVETMTVEKMADKSLITSLREKSTPTFLPAFLISDGTINITALIVALYFEKKPLIIIEEPERNIHPYLISRVVDMMKDVSGDMKRKQIIITTHNPEVVKYAGLDHLLLVYRDEKGFSRISRPSEKKEVETFLKNDIGVDELFVQNLLEW